jgi:hypothetical protein
LNTVLFPALNPLLGSRYIGQGNSSAILVDNDDEFFRVAYQVCEETTLHHMCVAAKNVVGVPNPLSTSVTFTLYESKCNGPNSTYSAPSDTALTVGIDLSVLSINGLSICGEFSADVTIDAGSLIAIRVDPIGANLLGVGTLLAAASVTTAAQVPNQVTTSTPKK